MDGQQEDQTSQLLPNIDEDEEDISCVFEEDASNPQNSLTKQDQENSIQRDAFSFEIARFIHRYEILYEFLVYQNLNR